MWFVKFTLFIVSLLLIFHRWLLLLHTLFALHYLTLLLRFFILGLSFSFLLHLLDSKKLLLEFLSLTLSLLFLPLALLFLTLQIFLSQSFFAFALLQFEVESSARLERITDFESVFEFIHVLLLGHGSLMLVSQVHLLLTTAAPLILKLVLELLPLPG